MRRIPPVLGDEDARQFQAGDDIDTPKLHHQPQRWGVADWAAIEQHKLVKSAELLLWSNVWGAGFELCSSTVDATCCSMPGMYHLLFGDG